jgi:hypothetical protein
MMNRIGIGAEDRMGSREPWFGDHRATSVPEHGGADPGVFDGSGVEMAGMAEGYWKELRPSSAARLRLDATLHNDQEPTARDPSLRRRQRRPGRSKLRPATSRG